MSRLIIGYQGSQGSNNHAAAMHFAETHNWPDAELRPMVCGKGVIEGLVSGELDYGVFAYSTDLIGLVQENAEARKGVDLDYLDRYVVNVHHLLYKKNDSIPDEAITAISSHPEALRECKENVARLYPNVKLLTSLNSGYAAHALESGELPENVAVLCNKAAGERYHLALMRENIEDLKENGTSFMLVKLSGK